MRLKGAGICGSAMAVVAPAGCVMEVPVVLWARPQQVSGLGPRPCLEQDIGGASAGTESTGNRARARLGYTGYVTLGKFLSLSEPVLPSW